MDRQYVEQVAITIIFINENAVSIKHCAGQFVQKGWSSGN